MDRAKYAGIPPIDITPELHEKQIQIILDCMNEAQQIGDSKVQDQCLKSLKFNDPAVYKD